MSSGKKDAPLQAAGDKALVTRGKVRSTFSALAGAAALGFDFEGVVGVIMALTPADFHKA